MKLKNSNDLRNISAICLSICPAIFLAHFGAIVSDSDQERIQTLKGELTRGEVRFTSFRSFFDIVKSTVISLNLHGLNNRIL